LAAQQQRLVSLSLQLRAAQAAVPTDLDELTAEPDGVAVGLTSALDELREYARGIHPKRNAKKRIQASGIRPSQFIGRSSPRR
jgi:hypothetical protein